MAYCALLHVAVNVPPIAILIFVEQYFHIIWEFPKLYYLTYIRTSYRPNKLSVLNVCV